MQLIIGFVFILLTMTGIVWLSQSLRMIDWMVNKGVSFSLFLHLTMLVLPNFISIILPIALFIVVLFVYSKLTTDQELIVMKSVGMSPLALSRPALYFAGVLFGIAYLMSMLLVPYSVNSFRQMTFKIRNDLAHVAIKEGEFNKLPNDVTVYVRVFTPDGYLKGIMIKERKDADKKIVLVAEEGYFFVEDNVPKIMMKNGTRQEYNVQSGVFSSLQFEQYTMAFEEGAKKSGYISTKESGQSFSRLLSVTRQEVGDKMFRTYKVEALSRIIQPFFVWAYLGIALIFVLLAPYNRRGNSIWIISSIIGVVLIQSMAIAFKNLSEKNLWFCILMVLNVLLPILISIILIKPIKLKILKRWMVLLWVLFSFSAFAEDLEFIQDKILDKTTPVDFSADVIEYDKENDSITASGHVELIQGQSKMTADKVVVYQKTKRVYAIGNVYIKRPDNVVLTAESAELEDGIKEGVLNGVQIKLADGSFFKASKVRRQDDGEVVRLKDVYFTACQYCHTCQNDRPLWNIEASSVKHSYPDREFTYKNAWLKFYGIPVFYWPYLQYPDFQVKRKSGFMTPAFVNSSELGTGIETPFFWAINDYADLYISPTISKNFLLQGRYRQNMYQSRILADFSVLDNQDDRQTDGHVKLFYENDINEQFRFRTNIFRVSNDTYFRRYPIDNVDDELPWLQSDAELEYFNKAHYANVKVYDFQNLRQNVTNQDMPLVPTANYIYTSDPIYKGLYTQTHLNYGGIYAQDADKTSRLTVQQDFIMPYISKSSGLVFDHRLNIRLDEYFINYKGQDTRDTMRFIPTISSKIRYPLMKRNKSYSQTLQPIVMAVMSPNSGYNYKVINYDSLDVGFNDTNLFAINRFPGYDYVETGARLNYGIQWNLFARNKISMDALIGQSYRFSEQRGAPSQLGFDDDFSSYVGHLNFNFDDLNLSYRFRLNKDDFAPEMSELSTSFGRNPLRMTIGYLYLTDTSAGTYYMQERDEIFARVDSQISQEWSVYGYYRYSFSDLDNGPLESGVGIKFENDCFAITGAMEKDFAKDRDYSGDTSFFVRLVLKTLGEI